MNVKFYFLTLAAAVITTSCNVDEGYDLLNVKTDNIEVGTEDSEFSVPLATITITSDDLNGTGTGSVFSTANNSALITRSSNSFTFTEVLEIINAFLPSDMDIEIAELVSEETRDAKIDELVDYLAIELLNDTQKRADLASVIYTYQSTLDESIFNALSLSSTATHSLSTISTALDAALADDDSLNTFKAYVATLIKLDIASVLEEYSSMDVDQSIDPVELPSDITDILGEDELLQIIATYSHNFPFSFVIDELVLDNAGEEIRVKMTYEGEEVSPTEVYMSQISSILESGANLSSAINLTTYKSVALGDYSLIIKISIVKKGAIKF